MALDEILTKEDYQPATHNSFGRFMAAFGGALLTDLVVCPLLFNIAFRTRIYDDWSQLITVSAQRTQINSLLDAMSVCAILFFSIGIGIIVSSSTRTGASLFCLFKRGVRVTITIALIVASLLLCSVIFDDAMAPHQRLGELIK